MFDIGGGELLVIGIIALVVIGPKELPGLLRTVGNAMGKVRRMAGEFRMQFDEAMREAELDQAKKAFNDMNDVAQSAKPAFNPLDTIRNEIQSVKDEIQSAKNTAANAGATVPPPAPAAASSAPLPDPKIEPPLPAPPIDIKAEIAKEAAKTAQVAPPAEPAVVADAPAKPKRSRKKADGEDAKA